MPQAYAPIDLNTVYVLGGRLRHFLETTRGGEPARKRVDAYLRDLLPDGLQIRVAVSWLSQSGWLERITLIEGGALKYAVLREVSRDLASLFSVDVTRLALATLAGYIEINNGDLGSTIDSLVPAPAPEPERFIGPQDQNEELVIGPAEARTLLAVLPKRPLVGDLLLNAIRGAGEEASKQELVALCGYFTELEDGSLELRLRDFYESLLFARYKSLNPDSSLLSFPVKVFGTTARFNVATAIEFGLKEGFYSVSSLRLPGDPQEAIVLRPIDNSEMEMILPLG